MASKHRRFVLHETISADAARRIALSAQGFAARGSGRAPSATRLGKMINRVQLLQIDSVNVLVRAHYLPVFARLGPYPTALLDQLASGSKRQLFEYWGHEASLLPLALHPLLRWRMAQAERGEHIWSGFRPFAGERRREAEALLARIAAEGPLAASDVAGSRGNGGWWGWSGAKRALEWLFWAGRVTTAHRRGNFERVYDLTERVLPASILDQATPDPVDAHRTLLARAGAALGVATASDLRDYFRLRPHEAHPRIAELVDDGTLRLIRVEGWTQPAYLHQDAVHARRTNIDALLAPFDPLVWNRARTERLFGMRYRLEIYTPAEKRVHGYYVLPFLRDGKLVARADLKADRRSGQLLLQRFHGEPGMPDDTVERLLAECALMAQWLGLDAGVKSPSL